MPTALCTVANNSAITSVSDHSAADEVAMQTVGQMRRVASAPAFKHANAYQAPSPTAAVAEAQADAAAEAFQFADPSGGRSSRKLSSKLSSKLFSWGSAAASGKLKPCRTRCSNCSGGCCNCLEVYVVSRPFTEFGGDLIKNLPQEAKDGMVDLGLCHYMTVFKAPDGQLVQFDFGPMGGDVQKAHGPLATFLKRAHAATVAQAGQLQDQPQQLALAFAAAAAANDSSSSARGMVHSPSAPVLPLASLGMPGEVGEGAAAALTGQPARRPRTKGVAGEIRERQLEGLPPASLYMGRTQLSLSEIRQYNSLQGNLRYTLHDNDCRHYVNSLVQYATGVERSTQHMKRQYFSSRNADKWLWYGWFISATQLITDVGNWSHVQAGAAVTLLAVTGRSTLAQLKTLTLPIVPVITRSIPTMLPSSKAAAAAAAAGGSAAAGGGVATTLKLPAGLLLKRPLAGTAVAAAGGAGAAAAAIRTVPMGHGSAATAASSSSNGSSSRGFGVWGTPLRQWREGIGQGLRGAVLTVRRLAMKQQGIVIERLRPGATARAAAAAAAAAPHGSGASGNGAAVARRGWFGRGRGSGSNWSVSKPQLAVAQAGAATAVVALPQPTAPTAVAPSRGRWGNSSSSGRGDTVLQHVQLGTDYAGSSSSRNSSKRPKVMLGLGHHVGRHMMWLGSTAVKATSAIAVLASKQMGYFTHKHNIGAVVAQMQGPTLSMSHSSSSGNLLGQQQQQQRTLVNQRSRSAPSLAVVAASDAAAAQYWDSHCPSTAPAATPAGDTPTPESFCFSEDLYNGCGYTSSLVCSSVGGRPSGVGRQVLNLPAPRLSWGRRASHGVIVCK